MAKVEHPTTRPAELEKRMKFVAPMETAEAKLLLPRVNTTAETAKTRVFREAKARLTAELILGQLFAWLKANVGVEDAWRDFNRWTEGARPNSLAGHRGPSDHRADRYLLGVYDRRAEVEKEKTRSLPRLIAAKLRHDTQGKYGNSVDAIAKKIRRLVREREAKRAIDAKVRAAQQRVIRKLGWDVPMGSTKQRRRNTSTKSRDK